MYTFWFSNIRYIHRLLLFKKSQLTYRYPALVSRFFLLFLHDVSWCKVLHLYEKDNTQKLLIYVTKSNFTKKTTALAN